jgi:DNA-binding SARP family transcriptional activator
MKFNLLGPMEVMLGGRQVPAPRRAKERCLLAVLLMEPNRWLRIESLIHRVWDDDDPSETMKATFRSYMSHVKDALEVTSGEVRLESGPDGYLLQVDPECVDVHRFRRLRNQAAAMAQTGDSGVAAELLRDAENLWRGPALAGLPGRWMADVRHGLEEEHWAVTLKRVELELELGRHAELVSELQRLSAEHPLDETVLAHRMTALYRCGRHTDALDIYQQARGRFTQMGIEPSARVRELQRSVLRHAPELAAPPPRGRPTAQPTPNYLPLSASEFVGREEEIARLTSTVSRDTERTKVIAGMAGIGKTALAIEAAKRMAGYYPGAHLYLKFGTYESSETALDAAAALRRLLEMTGTPLNQIPFDLRGMMALWQRELVARKMIVILDDVPGADAVEPLLPKDGECLVIVTSRDRLHLPGSFTISLDVLPMHEASALFTRTAGQGKIDDSAIVAKAVRICGCLPLAITLTASRLRESSPATLAEFVDNMEEMHGFPNGFAGASHELMATFELSYRGLTTREQEFFRRLGVSSCSDFSVKTAAVAADVTDHESKAFLDVLLERHLIEQSAQQRFRLHDLLKSYAEFRARQDDSAGEQRGSLLRTLNYFLYNSDRADRLLYPHRRRAPVPFSQRSEVEPVVGSVIEAQDWLESEWHNILRAADFSVKNELQWYCSETAYVLSEFMDVRGSWGEATEVHSHALQACRDTSDLSGIARASLDLSLVNQRRGRYGIALERAEEALSLYKRTGNRHGQALATDRIGTIQYYLGRFREALAYDHEARELYREAGDRSGEAVTIFNAGVSSLNLGRSSESIKQFKEALAIFEHTENPRGRVKAMNSIAEIKMRQGHHREALQIYKEALSLCESMGARRERAVIEQNIGIVYLYKKLPQDALHVFRNALATYRDMDDLPGQACAMCDIGDAYLGMDRYHEALIHHENAASLAEEIGNSYIRMIALRGMGDSFRGVDRSHDAMRHYNEALELERDIEDP